MSGEALPVLGMFTIPLDIANGSYSCTFVVVQDLPYDALLRRDFLRENGAIINLKESTLQLDGKRDEPYPERELAQGLSCDQSPVQSTRRKDFTEEHSATEKTPIKQSRASRKRALPPAFIETLFFPSDKTNVPKESYRRPQQISAIRLSGKKNVSRLFDPSISFDHALYRFIPTDCIARNGAWPKRLQISDDFTDICHTRASFWHKKRCESTRSSVPHKPKRALYKIGQAKNESQTTRRKPPQPVKQRITKQFPPMTSSDADFPARLVYDVPRSSSTLKHEFFSQESSHVNPLHSDISTVEREIQGMPIPYLWSCHRHTHRTYFSPDRLVLSICVAKYRSR